MFIKLYNSLTKNVELFTPIVTNEIGLYVCGVTVYDHCHLGHGRIFVVFDLLHRLFKTLGYKVNYVRNITDVDDKIIQKANQLSMPFYELANRYYLSMLEDEKALNVLPPSYTPKASEHIKDIISFIEELITKKYAYVTNRGSVYFAIQKFEAYGNLAHQSIENLISGVRINAEEEKTHPLDFALWKASKPNEPSWDAPWGSGRPGWHIECSAMARKYLGDHFDLHGGGADLLFPHHQNELAQSQAITNQKLANYWMHVGFVQYQDEKMSKSLGNFFTLKDLYKEFDGEIIRYFYLTSHYQNPINFSYENLVMAENSLRRLYLAIKNYDEINFASTDFKKDPYYQRFFASLADNLNTPECLAVLFEVVREINQAKLENKVEVIAFYQNLLKILGSQLGIFTKEPEFFLKSGIENFQEIEELIQNRLLAKQNKDWKKADQIRNLLNQKGIILEDKNNYHTEWYVSKKK